MKKILVTGGAGYVGSSLVPLLLEKGYFVRVLDLFLYDKNIFSELIKSNNLEIIVGDLRDRNLVESSLIGIDTIIHLGCLSNDPSCELNEELTKSINLDAGKQLVDLAKNKGIKRFINASSASVYGIKSEADVTEKSIPNPITLYSKYKLELEKYLHNNSNNDFSPVTIRPATVCGYSSRMRLDLTVNILTYKAIHDQKITVFGGEQSRPNIHIKDLINIYLMILEAPKEKIHNQIFNAGFENHKIIDIAKTVQNNIDKKSEIIITPTDDLRSYHISSEKIKNTFSFENKYSIIDAINDIQTAYKNNLISNSQNTKYNNVNHILKNNLLV